MQMGYDFNEAGPTGEVPAWSVIPGWPRAGSGADGAFAPRRPDWASLRARFVALHALRQTIPPAPAAALPVGGFADSGESVLSSCRAGTAVNPLYWANVKEDSAITGPVVASPTRDDRGMA